MDLEAMKRRELQELCRRHGVAARGSRADLAASLAGALSQAAAVAAAAKVAEVVLGKGCLKRVDGGASGGSTGAAKKVRFAVEEKAEVTGRQVVAKAMGSRKAGEAPPSAVVRRRHRRRKRIEISCDSADEADGEVGGGAAVTRFSMNSVSPCADSGVESRNNPTEVEEEGKAVGEAVDKKQKRKTQENAINAQGGASYRSVSKSSSSATAVLLSPAVGKDEHAVEEQVAAVQDSATTASPAIVDCVPAVQKPAEVEVEREVRRKSENLHPDGELPAVYEAPTIGAPVTRFLRNRIAQVDNNAWEEIHVDKKLENKRKPSRPSTHRHQQLVSSVEEKEQVAAPCKLPRLTRLTRNYPEADELLGNGDSETNKLSSPMEAMDLKVDQQLTCTTANISVEDNVTMADKEVHESVRDKVAGNASGVLFSDDNGKTPGTETQLAILDERAMGTGHVRCEGFQNAKGEDVGKQPKVRQPVRRSTRRCVVAGRT